jgi:hypothetical protein
LARQVRDPPRDIMAPRDIVTPRDIMVAWAKE